MYFKRELALAKVMIRMRISRYRSFKLDGMLLFISNLIFLVATILFWYIVNDVGFLVEGWSYPQLLVFIALSELFYGFEQNVFSVTSLFWQLIYNGSLDAQLVRPIDPRKRFLLLNVDYMGLLISFVKVGVILALANVTFNPVKLLFAGLVIFAANYVLMRIRFIICYLAFWNRKMDSLTQICDSFTQFNKYPLVIFPQVVKIIFQTILPFYFFSTFSAEFVLDKLSGKNLALMLVGLCINLIFWSLLNQVIWQLGRKNYESISG